MAAEKQRNWKPRVEIITPEQLRRRMKIQCWNDALEIAAKIAEDYKKFYTASHPLIEDMAKEIRGRKIESR